MICPKCSNQFDIYNAIIAEDKENEGRWICPECKVPLNDTDAVTVTGGVADMEQIPPGIIVKIRDYDIEGYDDDKLAQNEAIQHCLVNKLKLTDEHTFYPYLKEDDCVDG